MNDIIPIIRQCQLDEPVMSLLQDAADEIERLRSAILDWAHAIWLAEGVLFLDGSPCEPVIEAVLEAERVRRAARAIDQAGAP